MANVKKRDSKLPSAATDHWTVGLGHAEMPGFILFDHVSKADLISEIERMKPGQLRFITLVVDVVRRNPAAFVIANGSEVHGVKGVLPEEVVRRMIGAIPHEDTTMADWNELIGPFYDTAALTEWLGVTKQAIYKRIGKTLLAVRAENGDVRYPSFQFLDDGHVIPKLMAVCQKLGEAGVDEWGQAQWVNTPIAQLGDRTIAQTLASEREQDVALAVGLAESQAARLAA